MLSDMPRMVLGGPNKQPIELEDDHEFWVSWPGVPPKVISARDLASIMGSPDLWLEVERRLAGL